VFLLDPWWNPAVEDQAADRAHRIGQDKPVFVHRLVARGTVEEGILALQQRKRELAASAVSEGTASSSITRDDLLALLD
jgi:SNF2 family DNA or RNA helicase